MWLKRGSLGWLFRAVTKRNLWVVIRMVKTGSFGWLLVSSKKGVTRGSFGWLLVWLKRGSFR